MIPQGLKQISPEYGTFYGTIDLVYASQWHRVKRRNIQNKQKKVTKQQISLRGNGMVKRPQI